MIRILSETAGLYLHPTPKRMLYVLVSEEPQTLVSCGLSIVAYVRIVRPAAACVCSRSAFLTPLGVSRIW
jgi:hypothetical protein